MGAAVRLLLQHDYQVTVLDNLSRGQQFAAGWRSIGCW